MKNRSNWVPMTLAALLVMAIPVFLLAAGDATAGKALYDKKCATCHGKLGEGNPNLAKTLKVEFRHLGSKEVQAKSDDELKKVDRKSTRLNSSHGSISYAVFCLKKKKHR